MRVIYANDDLGGYDRRCTYFVGPIIGAGISQVIQQFFYTWFGARWPLVFGLLFVLIVMFLPYGIVGTWRIKKPDLQQGWQRLWRLISPNKKDNTTIDPE